MKIIISKQAEVRKQEIIDAALQLFNEKGHENTTIDHINKKVGVTKGSFYYHFKSKEDLLETMANQLADKTIKITEKICYDDKLNALEKMNAIIAHVYEHRIRNVEKYRQLFNITEGEKNLILKKRVGEKVFKQVKAPYLYMLKQGIKEGVFKTVYEEEIYEVVMILADFYRKIMFLLFLDSKKKPQNIENMKRKARFLQEIMAEILGVPAGRLNIAEQMLKPYNLTPI